MCSWHGLGSTCGATGKSVPRDGMADQSYFGANRLYVMVGKGSVHTPHVRSSPSKCPYRTVACSILGASIHSRHKRSDMSSAVPCTLSSISSSRRWSVAGTLGPRLCLPSPERIMTTTARSRTLRRRTKSVLNALHPV